MFLLYHRWNINSVEVYLRQWLYNHGNQYVHNTGGWRHCKEDANVLSEYGADDATITKDIKFTASSIILSGSIYASATRYVGGDHYQYYSRSGGLVNAYIGTSKPMPISSQKYEYLHMVGSNGDIHYSVRTGSPNDENTTVSTATVLQAGSGESADLKVGDYNPYLVLGATLDYPGVHGLPNCPGDLDVSFLAEITEIYLV